MYKIHLTFNLQKSETLMTNNGTICDNAFRTIVYKHLKENKTDEIKLVISYENTHNFIKNITKSSQ